MTSTVRDVIKMLEKLDPDLPVVYESDSDFFSMGSVKMVRQVFWDPTRDPARHEQDVALIWDEEYVAMDGSSGFRSR